MHGVAADTSSGHSPSAAVLGMTRVSYTARVRPVLGTARVSYTARVWLCWGRRGCRTQPECGRAGDGAGVVHSPLTPQRFRVVPLFTACIVELILLEFNYNIALAICM